VSAITSMNKRFITLTEAAAILGVSYSTMRRLIRQGKINAIRVGRIVLIPKEEIEKLIKELTKGGG